VAKGFHSKATIQKLKVSYAYWRGYQNMVDSGLKKGRSFISPIVNGIPPFKASLIYT